MYSFLLRSGRGGVKILENRVTYYMGDPLIHNEFPKKFNVFKRLLFGCWSYTSKIPCVNLLWCLKRLWDFTILQWKLLFKSKINFHCIIVKWITFFMSAWGQLWVHFLRNRPIVVFFFFFEIHEKLTDEIFTQISQNFDPKCLKIR